MTDHQAAATPSSPEDICNITTVIEAQARQHPAALALILPDRVVSYRELVTGIHAIARTLLDHGVAPGQILGVSMLQTPLHLMTLLAIARIGAIAVAAHPNLPLERRELAASRFHATAIVSGRPDMAMPGRPFIQLGEVDLATAAPPIPPAATRANDACWISLSSGTSGDPKGVLRSHGYMLDRVHKSVYVRTRHSRLLPMDLNFGVGFGQSMRMLALGGTVVLTPNNLPANLAYMARTHAVTHWLLSPSWAEDILPLLVDDDIHFPSLDYLQIVGATPSKRLLEALLRKFTPNVHVDYGTSEVGSVAVATPEILRHAPTSAGKIAPWVNLQIVDGRNRPVPIGKSGRLRLKLDNMFGSYHLDQALTDDRFHGGWYYPHDSAHIDAAGLLYIDGREDDVINIGGAKIQLRDVETAIEAHPLVREAAAFVAPHRTGREMFAVAVMLSSPLPLVELEAWVVNKLGPLCPEKLVIANELPRTATGKVIRDLLATALASKLA